MQAKMLRCASTCRSGDADRVRIIYKQVPPEFLRQSYELDERSQIAFHAEHAIGGDKAKAISGAHVGIEFRSKIADVGVLVDFAIDRFGAAQAGTVDDARVVQAIAVDHVPILIEG